MGLKIICFLALIIVILHKTNAAADKQLPESPCQSIFTYKTKDGTEEPYGYLQFTNDLSGDYQLEVRMSVAKRTNKNISIVRLPSEKNIQCGDPLEYEVHFPKGNIIPLLTYVKFNGKIYCTGPPAKDANRNRVTQLHENDGFVTNIPTECEEDTKTNPAFDIEARSFNWNTERAKQDGCGILDENKDKDRPGREHYPWLATLFHSQENNNNLNSYICSGTLVTNSHVLTVAHRMHNLTKSEILVRLGRNNIKAISSSSQTTIRTVQSIRIHPEYDPELGPRGHNIAILKLNGTVEFSDLIRPLCLWTGSEKLDDIVGKQGSVIGWGADAKPRKFLMPIVSQESCLRSHEIFKELLDPTSFCAGNRDGVVPCIGNSGGSLMIKGEDDRYYLRGLTSAALIDQNGICDGYQYNLFTDTALLGKWIRSVVYSSRPNYSLALGGLG